MSYEYYMLCLIEFECGIISCMAYRLESNRVLIYMCLCIFASYRRRELAVKWRYLRDDKGTYSLYDI